MKILHFSPLSFPSVGGIQIAVHSLCMEQLALGHDVRLLTSYGNWRNRPAGLSYPVSGLTPRAPSIALKLETMPKLGRIFVAAQLAAMRRRWKFDLLHVHLAYPHGFLASLYARHTSAASVITCHGIDIQKDERFGYGYRLGGPKIEARLRDTFASYDAVTVVGGSMRGDLKEIGVTHPAIHQIPNGADYARIAAREPDHAAIRARWNLPSDCKLLACVGRYAPKKGFLLLPAIAQQLRKSQKNFRIVLAGPGNEIVLGEARKQGVEEFVQIIPKVDEGSVMGTDGVARLPSDGLIDLLKSCDAFLFPTLLEGMPLVLVEAMAAGLPVFTTNAPGCDDIARNHVTAFVAQAGSAEEMAEKLRILWEQPALAKTVAQAGMEAVHADYTWNRVARQYVDLYPSLRSGAVETQPARAMASLPAKS